MPSPADDRPGGTGRHVLDEVHVALSQDLRAPGEARVAVRTTLDRWHLGPLTDAVVLAVSELVTNGIRHGEPPVRLVLSRGADDVRADVHDEAPGEPHALPAHEGAMCGRGLSIVEAVSQANGVEQVADDGKIVFATFDAPPGKV